MFKRKRLGLPILSLVVSFFLSHFFFQSILAYAGPAPPCDCPRYETPTFALTCDELTSGDECEYPEDTCPDGTVIHGICADIGGLKCFKNVGEECGCDIVSNTLDNVCMCGSKPTKQKPLGTVARFTTCEEIDATVIANCETGEHAVVMPNAQTITGCPDRPYALSCDSQNVSGDRCVFATCPTGQQLNGICADIEGLKCFKDPATQKCPSS